MRLRPGDTERPAFVIVRQLQAGKWVSIRMLLRQYVEHRRYWRERGREDDPAVLVGDLTK
jgi:hypothetical protein